MDVLFFLEVLPLISHNNHNSFLNLRGNLDKKVPYTVNMLHKYNILL